MASSKILKPTFQKSTAHNLPIITKIAIVGNSQAYLMSKAVGVDDDINSSTRTNNAVGGACIWSDNIAISGFPYRAKDYDICILFFGSNELSGSLDYYLKQFKLYTQNIHRHNADLKIYVMEISKFKTIRAYDYLIDLWNNSIAKYCEKIDYLKFTKLPSDVTFTDERHLDDISLQKTYNSILSEIEKESNKIN